MARSFWSRMGGFMSSLFKAKMETEHITALDDFIKELQKPSYVSYVTHTNEKPVPVENTLVLTDKDKRVLLPEVEYIKDKYLKYSYSMDEAARGVLRWKTHKYPNWKFYKLDIENYGIVERWCTPYETLTRGSFDCEDIAIVMYHLMRMLGIPAERLRVVAGEVKYIDGSRGGGHCYCLYFSEAWNDWVVIESTWYDDVSLLEYGDGIMWRDHPRYGRAWFSFNENGAYSSSETYRIRRNIFEKM